MCCGSKSPLAIANSFHGIASASHGAAAVQSEPCCPGRIGEPLARRSPERALEERVTVGMALGQPRADLEAGGANQLLDKRSRRHPDPGFDPPDRRLRHARSPSQLALGQAGPPPGLTDQVFECHRNNYSQFAITRQGAVVRLTSDSTLCAPLPGTSTIEGRGVAPGVPCHLSLSGLASQTQKPRAPPLTSSRSPARSVAQSWD